MPRHRRYILSKADNRELAWPRLAGSSPHLTSREAFLRGRSDCGSRQGRAVPPQGRYTPKCRVVSGPRGTAPWAAQTRSALPSPSHSSAGSGAHRQHCPALLHPATASRPRTSSAGRPWRSGVAAPCRRTRIGVTVRDVLSQPPGTLTRGRVDRQTATPRPGGGRLGARPPSELGDSMRGRGPRRRPGECDDGQGQQVVPEHHRGRTALPGCLGNLHR